MNPNEFNYERILCYNREVSLCAYKQELLFNRNQKLYPININRESLKTGLINENG